MDEHTLNDLLECSVCLERLDTSSKVLPCQHTFCRKCLEVIVASRDELRCPECRVLVSIKIDELPPNVLLMRILEGMKNAAAKSHHAANDSNKIEESQKINEEHQQQIKLKQLQHQQQQKQLLQYQQQQQFKQKQQIALQQHQQQAAATNASGPAQQRRCLVPHAYALYDFISNEASDLNFKIGELILLKRKIDTNWYVGQLNGVEGTFPINYVQVIVPLPSPQCIALYDFKMGPNEEEGCLSFKKGTLIHVLRRVDHNWAEGRIASTIGIFPIAFVELNILARQLLDSFLLANSSGNVLAPPAAVVPTQASAATASTQQPATNNPRHLPPIPILDPTTNLHASDSTSSSSTNSPSNTNTTVTTCSSNSNSTTNSMPSSPIQSLPSTPQHIVAAALSSGSSSVRYRDAKEKRHSLNALLTAGVGIGGTPTLSVLQSNRHSAEILSVPSELSAAASNATQTGRQSSGDSVSPPSSATSPAAAPQTTAAREQQQQSLTPAITSHSRVNVMKTCGPQNLPPSLPWGYLALYPYKARKGDELELKKGCVYIVTERCLDGWFKGKNWQDISGVFPGNYVTPLRQRDQQQLMHQWKYVPLQNSPTPTAAHTTAPNSKNDNHLENINTRLAGGGVLPHQPPDLPPRQLGMAATTATSSSVWTKPLGHTVEAFFNRSNNKAAQPNEHPSKDSKDKQKETTAPAASSSSSSCSASAAVNLMKRLTHMKSSRSKSPNNSNSNTTAKQQQQQHPTQNTTQNYSMDNPTFEDNPTPSLTVAAHPQLHPVHVRSGSCPSQLLQSLPIDLSTAPQMNENMLSHPQQQPHKQQISPHAPSYGSQRLKGSKERPQLPNTRQSMDGTFRSMFNNTSAQQQPPHTPPSNNILLTKCSQQMMQTNLNTNSSSAAIIHHHRKSQSLDANSIMATAPQVATPTTISGSSAALPCNITAAVAASATTKSTQNTRESRFRCVVPYPPNSDIELELHVGDIIYVHRKQKNGWYKGTHARTNKTGLFPASFVEPDI